MRRSEAITAITPAMGAIQNTKGFVEVRVCRGMYMHNKPSHFAYKIFHTIFLIYRLNPKLALTTHFYEAIRLVVFLRKPNIFQIRMYHRESNASKINRG
jgi:hypothetical protein